MSQNSLAVSKDQNNTLRWVIVELSHNGEREGGIDAIKASIRKILRIKDLRIFIPAVSQQVRDDSQTLFFMDGYIFVEYRPGVRYVALKDVTFFREVLCNSIHSEGSTPSYSLLNDSDLDPMRDGLQEMKRGSFSIGDEVRVITGSYKNLRGIVSIVYNEQTVQLSVSHLDSKLLLIDFPSTYLMMSKNG